MAVTGSHNSKYGRRCHLCSPWTDLEPTDEVRGEHRVWRCTKCGNETLWLADPEMDGSHAQLHKYKGGGYSGLSMLNDPECSVFNKPAPKPVRRTRTTLPEAPEDNGPRKPIFVEDEHGNRTHRWHYGRSQWVKII